jgi:uncharacterized membrane protein YdjX (TVP38/TMEM64 family)
MKGISIAGAGHARGERAVKTSKSDRRKKIVRVGAIVLFVLGALAALQFLPVGRLFEPVVAWIEDLGAWGFLVFAALYVVAAMLLFPAAVLTLAAGALFGPWLGVLLVSFASTTTAALAFLVARHLARPLVERIAKKRPVFAAVDRAISEGGWKVVGMMRLSPIVPFGPSNYLFGLTSVRFWPYVLASWVGMLPGTFLYVWLGHAGGMAFGRSRERSPAEWWLLGAGIVATAAVTVVLTRAAKKELERFGARGSGRKAAPAKKQE